MFSVSGSSIKGSFLESVPNPFEIMSGKQKNPRIALIIPKNISK